ncbi:MAG: DUF427 domain-containing protein [Mycobacterium sp.]
MAVKVTDLLGSKLNALRYEPTAKRLRASAADQVLADTCDGLAVWEPGRIVPTYAVPLQDFSAELTPADTQEHTIGGQVYAVTTAGMTLPSAAFRPKDPDLADYLLLEFAQFGWREEDEPIVGHPRDPFHRIDILRSSRHVRIELDGHRLAESRRPVLLFETLLPVRFYLPADDVTAQMQTSDTVTYCAYKGRASYFSLPNGRSDIAWTYPDPLREAEPIRGHVCFFDEHVDVTVNGRRKSRPITPWSD